MPSAMDALNGEMKTLISSSLRTISRNSSNPKGFQDSMSLFSSGVNSLACLSVGAVEKSLEQDSSIINPRKHTGSSHVRLFMIPPLEIL